MGSATADALLEDIEQQQVQDALLPAFLQHGRERPQTNQALAQMQLMKEAALEHVRWRAICVNATDPNAAAVTSAMRALVRQWVQNEELVLPCRNLGIVGGTGAPGSTPPTQNVYETRVLRFHAGINYLFL